MHEAHRMQNGYIHTRVGMAAADLGAYEEQKLLRVGTFKNKIKYPRTQAL